MDPITTAILSWLTGEVGTASVRIIGKLARGSRQQIALEAIVTRSVDTAVDAFIADRERGDVREVLLRDFRQDTDAVGPATSSALKQRSLVHSARGSNYSRSRVFDLTPFASPTPWPG